MPDLQFRVADAEVIPFATVPTLLFKVAVSNTGEAEQIKSVMLRTQIRLEVTRRHYDTRAEEQLLELFGEPHRWGETLRSLLWTHATTIVPGFDGGTVVEMPITCTYDFDVAAAKYLHALEDGEIPLLFLFSGTIFYTHNGGELQISQIPWEREASFRLPVSAWKDMMQRYFPNSAWLRIRKDVFDRLYVYKARRALPTWEDALESLLADAGVDLER